MINVKATSFGVPWTALSGRTSRVPNLPAHTPLFEQAARGFLARIDAARTPAAGPLARRLPALLAGVLISAPGCQPDDDCRLTSTCPVPPDCMQYSRDDDGDVLRLSPSAAGKPCGENNEGVCDEKGRCIVTIQDGAGGSGGTYAEGGGGSGGIVMGDKERGELCEGPAECQTGYCVDKVCCDKPCDGACNHCHGNMDFPIGTCITHSDGFPDPACTPYLCSGGSACIEKCATDQDCVPWYLCDTFKGECIKSK